MKGYTKHLYAITLLVLLEGCFSSSNYISPPSSLINAHTTIAIIDFDGRDVSQNIVTTLTDRFRHEFIKQRQYSVVEREMMEEILSEQGLQQSGCISAECMVEVGKLIGVQRIIGGSIGKVGNSFSVSARMIDVETGMILKTASFLEENNIENLLKYGMVEVALKLLSNDYENLILRITSPKKKELDIKADFTLNIKIMGGTSGYELTFGFSPNATDGYDIHYDQYAPPAPPPPAFDAAIYRDGQRYYKQIVNGSANDLNEYLFDIVLEFGNNKIITLTWDIIELHNTRKFYLEDPYGGQMIKVDMTTQNHLKLIKYDSKSLID